MKAELYQQMRDIEDRHWWFRGRRRIIESTLEAISPAPKARILDLGCGTGGNFEMLGRFGVVSGAEAEPRARQLALDRGVAPVLDATLPGPLPYEPGSFDLITLLDVLEHVEDDGAALESIHRLLAPRGQLLLTVPAFEFLWGPHDEAHHHFRRYRRDPLRERLEQCGFTVRHLSYFNTLLFPPVALVRWMQKRRPPASDTSGTELPPGWLNRILEGLFASERWWVSRRSLPFGVSLMAVAEKTPG